MSEIKRLSQWNRDLALAIATLGSDDFFPALITAVQGQVTINYPQIWLYHPELPPRLLYHDIPKAAYPSQVDMYLEGPYREDPFYRASMNSPRSKIYRLSRLTGDALEDSTYYTEYYADTGTVDEAIFLARLEGGNAVNLSMMRLPAPGPFSDDEYERLYVLADAVSELMLSHSRFNNFAISNLIQPGIDHQIDLAFRTFGSSVLSPREKDVLDLMLRGYSTEVSASRLEIARETLRRHRKNIYRKLDVNSQTDLFALFINSMSCLGEAGGGDPLSVYMGPA
ncbi:MAG: helix-turn-helix transcriptional regulator [Chromatocurvus sp.]